MPASICGTSAELCGCTSRNSSLATCWSESRVEAIFSVLRPGTCTRIWSAPTGLMTGSPTPLASIRLRMTSVAWSCMDGVIFASEFSFTSRMRNAVPPLRSNPSAMPRDEYARHSPVNPTMSARPMVRLRTELSVPRYQPKRMRISRPVKKVSAGDMETKGRGVAVGGGTK